ncbi:bifunctional UDP-N-acetylglucosamine diphosphorylase/glucosamine-1-phosphate N-acetyltransferase GlmU [Oceanirhabdus seepicola]|uniref:Bifunctional protein GlmU n=1 Tax=Oceanirhabdus seepicola TaxID=2828781 RepID=A0A9J6P5H6_9CLOT|nr:bifunctional UDP-N-acetylglucosamine diphosphorylase/glucosamine-1-phosphate N-acetyltransferase GlmU [Oceanirhabdus seepicola]MCM1992066.1 bifunctional UDP-N-acetylglucosamine diphosphorylase/glucosamine-1-phosphate N-acetyltransferase GlmU [Oceanirhabdus seepicola]
MNHCAIILAAGKGTRMKSEIHKVLHKVCGKEMINHVVDNIEKAGIDDIHVVVGSLVEEVKKGIKKYDVTYHLQEEQLGTGHAVMCARKALEGKEGTVVILVGDGPMITESMLKELLEYHNEHDYKATVITSEFHEPRKYGRIVRAENRDLEKIVEFRDCTEDEKKIKEINSGMYCFDIKVLVEHIDKLSNDNSQKEYYLTDMIEILKSEGYKTGAFIVENELITAVNSREELAIAEKIMRNRINRKHFENGVTIINPDNTYIGVDVEIGRDTIIYPGVILEGNTKIGNNCIIYSNCRIKDSIIKNNITIDNSVILDSSIESNTTIGPFAYIRPESHIGENVKVGDFVEIKKSSIGDGTKISHLTYVGDAKVGKKCNFGCGTVVSNYDGTKKHITEIGDNAFIGCNTNLVSPVKVEDNTYIAAGSTITDTVPEGALAVARARQVNKENWVNNKGLKK